MTIASLLNMDIWKEIYAHVPDVELVTSRLVCKEFNEMLRILVSELHIRKPIAQSSLASLAKAYPNLAALDFTLKREDNNEALDWEDVHLPSLQHLRLTYCPLRSIVFTEVNTPSLVTLSIVGQDAAEDFSIALQKLTHLDISRVQVRNSRTLRGSVRYADLPCQTVGSPSWNPAVQLLSLLVSRP